MGRTRKKLTTRLLQKRKEAKAKKSQAEQQREANLKHAFQKVV